MEDFSFLVSLKYMLTIKAKWPVWLSIYMDLTHNDYNMKASKVFTYMFASVCIVYLAVYEVLGIHLVTHRASIKKKSDEI